MTGVGPTFRAHGLAFASEVSLPHLPRSSSPPDCTVRLGEVAQHLAAPIASGVDWEAESDRVLIALPGIGRFLVEPDQIVVARALGATEEQLAFAVTRGCLAPLLHLRGMLALHAAAVEVPGVGVVAIAGQSASGKSTLLMACVKRGWPMVTDEISVVTVDSRGTHRVAPGPPAICVWRDVCDHFQVPTEALQRVRPNLQKYLWPVDHVTSQDLALAAVVLLEPTEPQPVQLRRVDGAPAFALLRAQIRAVRIAQAVRPARLFSAVAALTSRVPVFRLTRPDQGLESLDALVESLASVPR